MLISSLNFHQCPRAYVWKVAVQLIFLQREQEKLKGWGRIGMAFGFSEKPGMIRISNGLSCFEINTPLWLAGGVYVVKHVARPRSHI